MMYKKFLFITLYTFTCFLIMYGNNTSIKRWQKKELAFESRQSYDNPLYDVDFFGAEFTSPSGEKLIVRGFWDGKKTWKTRFMPDQTGKWKYKTICSDPTNDQLTGIEGVFKCARNHSKEEG